MRRKRPEPAATRTATLRAVLEDRRRQITADMNGRMRDVRSRTATDREPTDVQDGADSDVQDDLDLALIQMKAETLRRIDTALRQLDAGVYGNCISCAEPISDQRLQALPFAVRCTACEQRRETRENRNTRQRPQNVYAASRLDAAD